ncbi:hypothetical protein KFK09_012529 [Dendrobium nobile]|uniref:Uncharacterized protein n=1 Tax=Dendrobium nobile TaxID=94219 RepID=A0A8T3BJ92_DENNO|nr:hypothetical protein KFK09_012529 [Dendrobium nobile]
MVCDYQQRLVNMVLRLVTDGFINGSDFCGFREARPDPKKTHHITRLVLCHLRYALPELLLLTTHLRSQKQLVHFTSNTKNTPIHYLPTVNPTTALPCAGYGFPFARHVSIKPPPDRCHVQRACASTVERLHSLLFFCNRKHSYAASSSSSSDGQKKLVAFNGDSDCNNGSFHPLFFFSCMGTSFNVVGLQRLDMESSEQNKHEPWILSPDMESARQVPTGPDPIHHSQAPPFQHFP